MTLQQNFANHRQTVPMFHFFLLPILALTLIGSVVNLVKSWGDHQRIYSASLIVVLAIAPKELINLVRRERVVVWRHWVGRRDRDRVSALSVSRVNRIMRIPIDRCGCSRRRTSAWQEADRQRLSGPRTSPHL